MKIAFVLFIFVLHLPEFKTDIDPQPTISTRNGNLVFSVASNKDVHFMAPGRGKIFLNGADLSEATSLAKNASSVLAQVRGDYFGTFSKVRRFERLIDGKAGIMHRLETLETGVTATNITNGGYAQYSVSTVNRRLRMLQRKVNRLIFLLSKNECASNPCKNGGECQDLFNNFLCHCPKEWEGTFCDKDVNECARFAGTDLGCQNGATCINKPGSYECSCSHGWFGIHCTRRSANCNSGSVFELCGHGTCISQNVGTGYKCICDQGWTNDGTNPACVVDVDECSSKKPPCSTDPLVPCVNIPGSFYCGSCPQGYTGNGYYCTDLDECSIFNGGCSMNPTVQCINTPGSRICGLCPPGYIGNGVSCSFQGICGVNNGGCHHLAQCRDNPRISSTYVECICPARYVGSGIGPTGCVHLSESLDPCTNNPCVHGDCIADNYTASYTCVCNRRFTGRNCDIRKNPCEPNPCENGGTCQSIADLSYRCICTASFTGSTCHVERQACGGRLNGEIGTLKYPLSNSTIGNARISCAWIIETNFTQVLNITFTKLNIGSNGACRYDWLQIHDGRNSAAQSLGRFCGQELPHGGTIVSTHNVVYLWFRENSASSGYGFELSWITQQPVCGNMITVESHGTIKSPGFPGNYPSNRDCYWYLTAQQQKRIQFHFFSLMIGNNSNCDSDYLVFHEGTLPEDKVFAKYCNTSHPEPLVSPFSEVLIHFHSDSRGNYPGFQIAYSLTEGIPGCGGVFTAPKGEISSPIEEGSYPNDVTCHYKIRSALKNRIQITFLSFELEESEDDCSYDFVAIYDGGSELSPLIGKYCGNTMPPSLISNGNELFIVFSSDWDTNMAGFRLKYETRCGGRFTEPSGIIESPGYPNEYETNIICLYEIIQPLGTTIELQFTDFGLEDEEDCSYDFVEVRDGDNENSTLIGHYCQKPPPIQSSYNYLWIKFETDYSEVERGFQANYTTTKMGCGGILKANHGIIGSPEHPQTYPEGTTCTWIIVAPAGFIIQLQWVLFNLEPSPTCSFDYLEVYDNHTIGTEGSLIGRYCGNVLPPILISSSNVMTLKFESDTSISFEGFMINYFFLDERNTCNGKYFTSSGVIKSPNYPKLYPDNRECVWVITVKTGEQILLNVTEFELETTKDCSFDFLEIRNGGTSSSPLIGTFCGQDIPKLIPSHTNQLRLYFKSDLSVNYNGFKIFWESTATGCGGTLSSPQGSIISPYYPEPYGRNTECYWIISVAAGSKIQVVIADIDLEVNANCKMDYLEFFDGRNVHAKSLGRYCSLSHPPFILSDTNNMLVKFRSDVSNEGRGFSLHYITVCTNTLNGFGGTIESPNYPGPYELDLECSWTIQLPEGNKINLTFTQFDIEGIDTDLIEGNCSTTYLEILYHDSEGEQSKFRTFCENNTPSKMDIVTIPSNLATIHFVSKTGYIGSGFRTEWQLFGCGGILTHPRGTFHSPNYPNNYPISTQCHWIIKVEYGNSIELDFIDVNLELSQDCAYDYIEIYNGPDTTYPLLTTICGKNKKNTKYTSIGSTVLVRFSTDQSYHGRGFLANYSLVPKKCGGILNAPSGSFHSPNYPQNYDEHDLCEWSIEVESGHIIELKFSEVDFPGNCTDSIKVYDSTITNNTLLATVCRKPSSNFTIKSTSNNMKVVMFTEEPYTAKGFLATYTQGCGARILVEDKGLLDIEKHANVDFIEDCSWTLVATDPSKHISLSITYLNVYECLIEKPDDLSHFRLKIFNGESDEAPLIYRICDNKIPPVIISDGNALHLQTNPPIKMTASYSVFDSHCGGVITAIDGFIASPRYPRNYPNNIECEWTLNVTTGNSISLSFVSFDLIESEHCNVDFLEIRENSNEGKLLGIFCGDNKPTNVTNVGTLWILFKSGTADGFGGTAKGFLAEYALNHENTFTGESGEIYSPLYPDAILNLGVYSWRINTNFGRKITIQFLDLTDDSETTSDCYANVYDGYDERTPILMRLCNFDISKSITSSSNVVYISMNLYSTWHSDIKFHLKWKQESLILKYPWSPKTNVTGCGTSEAIEITEPMFHKVTSPGYPNGYENNLKCEWIFTTNPGNHLAVTFSKIDFNNILDICRMDFVEIFGQYENEWKSVSIVCRSNDTYANDIEVGNKMKLLFRSDNFQNGTGFSADVYKKCGDALTGSFGVINVNATELKHESFDNSCQWNVTVRTGKRIKVTLSLLFEDDSEHSCKNYVLLKNGHYVNSPILGKGKYCGNSSVDDTPLITTGNQLYIKYFATIPKDLQITYAEESSTCGQNLVLSKFNKEVNISSPNYPNIPTPYIECFWSIRAPPGQSLRVDFIERFDLTDSRNCELEAVEIRDGGSIFSPLLGKYCKEMPSSLYSADNMVFIKFFTNVEDPKNGFKVKVSIASCGGLKRGTGGKIQSPNFNKKDAYPINVDCYWHIIAPSGHYLNINFLKFDVGYKEDACDVGDHVSIDEVFEYNDTLSNIGKYCGSENPTDVRSSSNQVVVHLVTSNIPLQQAGFSLVYTSSTETCGGELRTSSGVIQSPGYPIMKYHRECEWAIQVQPGRRITLEIEDFDMDYNTLGFVEGIVIFNDRDLLSLIAHPRSLNATRIFKSSTNTMHIIFWTSYPSNRRGFKAKYSSDEPTICTGNFNASRGIITQPNENNYYCSWKHFASKTNQTLAMKITMHTTTFQPTSETCKHSSNSLLITTDNSEETLRIFCKTYSEPIIVRSPYYLTQLYAYQGKLLLPFNFTVDFVTHDCGGIMTSPQGTIASPANGPQIRSTIDCSWRIKLEEDEQLKITFATFNLDDNCEYNYINVYNGAYPDSPRIGKYCFDSNPRTIQSEGNNLLIEYHADERSTGEGFTLEYETVTEGCGGIYHVSDQTIKTPLYPKEYPNNAECTWEINAQNGYHISLKFLGRFFLEQSENCEKDFVEVWNYKDEVWSSLGKYCGRDLPPVLNSTSNRMKILFRSDNQTNAAGFMARWTFRCGGIFLASKQEKYVVSPGYPFDYKNNLKCVYEIQSPNQFMSIYFEDFILESAADCRFDNLSISNAHGSHSYIHTTLMASKLYCGTTKPPPLRVRGTAIIRFATDSWLTRKGFKFVYKTDDCGGDIKTPQIIESPYEDNSKSKYIGSLNCFWNITAPADKIVVIRFLQFHLEQSMRCYYDFVEIYDGSVNNVFKRLAKICGNLTHNLPVIKSTENSMLVRMVTDYERNYSGFKAVVYFMYGERDGCGGTITVNGTKVIEAPQNLPNLDCQWQIRAEKDHTIKITFDELHLLPCSTSNTIANGNSECKCNSIEVRDGGGPFAELMYKLCGNTIPPTVTTSGQTAWIRLSTLGETKGKPFTVTLQSEPTICGPTILTVSNATRTLTSPNFPNSYPSNIRCSWILKTDSTFDKFDLKFKHFDLQDGGEMLHKCTEDRVEIVDRMNRKVTSESLGSTIVYGGTNSPYVRYRAPAGVHQFCGKTALSYDYYSGENQVVVSFFSGNGNHGTGFEMEYRLAGCNRNFTAPQGRVYGKLVKGECIITITAPENSTISLYFMYLIMWDSKMCEKVKMEIRDGNSKGSPVLATLCGSSTPDPVFSTGRYMWINIRNTDHDLHMAYDAIYTTTSEGRGCGGAIYNYGGKITSPMYPSDYRSDASCTWEIWTPQNVQVALKFTVFDVRGPCDKNYVTVITYTSSGSTPFKYCKTDNPALLTSETNHITIVYSSSVNNGGTGWIAQFAAFSSDTKLDGL